MHLGNARWAGAKIVKMGRQGELQKKKKGGGGGEGGKEKRRRKKAA